MFASKAPVPGDDGSSARVGALGAAIGQMAVNLTVGKTVCRHRGGDTSESICLNIPQMELIGLADKDAEVFAGDETDFVPCTAEAVVEC